MASKEFGLSSSKEFDLLVFITRASPPHLGHYGIIKEAIKLSRDVLVLVGSANVARSIRNPFSVEERMTMLRSFCPGSVEIRSINDYPYNMPQWLENVQAVVTDVMESFLGRKMATSKIGLIGYNKDNTSYYLKRFPQWKGVVAPAYKLDDTNVFATINSDGSVQTRAGTLLSATDLRRVIFDPWGLHGVDDWLKYIPVSARDVIREYLKPTYMDDFRQIPVIEIGREELRYEIDYKQKWAPAPWKPTFICTDAVVVQSGHVVLVRRGLSPGKGLYALPGGFLEQEETLEECTLRELRQETQIALSDETLRRCVVAREIFDDPWRSIRGRTLTQASIFELRPDTKLPRVKGGDDADEKIGGKAFWMPIADINPRHMYEDHDHIIHRMVGLLK